MATARNGPLLKTRREALMFGDVFSNASRRCAPSPPTWSRTRARRWWPPPEQTRRNSLHPAAMVGAGPRARLRCHAKTGIVAWPPSTHPRDSRAAACGTPPRIPVAGILRRRHDGAPSSRPVPCHGGCGLTRVLRDAVQSSSAKCSPRSRAELNVPRGVWRVGAAAGRVFACAFNVQLFPALPISRSGRHARPRAPGRADLQSDMLAATVARDSRSS